MANVYGFVEEYGGQDGPFECGGSGKKEVGGKV